VVRFGIGNRAIGFRRRGGLRARSATRGRPFGFKVGQSVNYRPGPRSQAGSSGVYKITQLLPPEGTERQYRIKSADEPHERVAEETDLKRVV
jgi:hypothetical protein